MFTKEITDAIQQIADKNGGRLTPDDLIRYARNPKSPLHNLFVWDIEKAAMEHWRDRARQIIRSVRVEIATHTSVIETIAYVRDPNMEHNAQGYVATEVLRDDELGAKKALFFELERVSAALHRARSLATAFGLESEVTRLIKRFDLVKGKVAAKTQSAHA